MKKLLCLLLGLVMLIGHAYAAGEFDGIVICDASVSVYAPFGGVISHIALREGTLLHVGDEIARVNTTKVLASEDGTVRGVFAEAGDSAESTVLYLAPVSKYTIQCSIDKAYDSVAAKYVTIGETVYIKCAKDGSHKAVGTITAVDGPSYTVQTTAGELYMEETVNLYRTPDYQTTQRIGSGQVSRTGARAVSGSGSVLKLHVKDGETVERGQVLFETVEGDIDAMTAVSENILSTVDGVIAQLRVNIGQRVAKGDVVLTAYRWQDYQVRFTIPEESLSAVDIGDEADIYFDWNEESVPYRGTVSDISYVNDADSFAGDTTYSGYLRFAADETVRLGMNVTVILKPEEE